MIPYRIENVLERTPWMNWTILGVTSLVSVALWGVPDDSGLMKHFVLGEGSPLAWLGHMVTHASPMHLVGNLVFLWVFGNGVCAMMGNFTYAAFYVVSGLLAAAAHTLINGMPMVGASGAIFGVVAAAVAFFPFTRVSVFYVLGMRPRVAQPRLWLIAIYWVLYDIVNGYVGHTGVAHFAHLGGFAAGISLGLAMLATGRAQLSQYDERSLLDVFRRRSTEEAQMSRARTEYVPALVPQVQIATDTPAPAARPAPLKLRGISAPAAPVAPTPDERAEADCFVFNGREKLGPLTAAQAMAMIQSAADTRGWLYWQTDMAAWEPVPSLKRAAATGTPALAPA